MFDTYKLCSHCGGLMAWNSYFGSYMCQFCGNAEVQQQINEKDQSKKLKQVGGYKKMGLRRMDLNEFREFGFLQEVNRQFFHPLGLALEVIIEEDGTARLGGIWDCRDDPEGILFTDGVLDKEKADRVEQLKKEKALIRQEHFGYVVQPINE